MLLIRHSMTEGNSYGRYIGARTDEPLCEKGRELLKSFSYPEVEKVFVSPMLRCRQTAESFFPGQELFVEELLRECDFGAFENKNYIELSGDSRYQEWMDSNGTLPFPDGESKEGFQKRCKEGFCRCLEVCEKEKIQKAAFVVHGGTVMSILDAYTDTGKQYYEWMLKNAEAYEIEVDETTWEKNRTVKVLGKYTGEGFETL